jgi:hypothetical protein
MCAITNVGNNWPSRQATGRSVSSRFNPRRAVASRLTCPISWEPVVREPSNQTVNGRSTVIYDTKAVRKTCSQSRDGGGSEQA